jgi:hypothetical protein
MIIWHLGISRLIAAASCSPSWPGIVTSHNNSSGSKLLAVRNASAAE